MRIRFLNSDLISVRLVSCRLRSRQEVATRNPSLVLSGESSGAASFPPVLFLRKLPAASCDEHQEDAMQAKVQFIARRNLMVLDISRKTPFRFRVLEVIGKTCCAGRKKVYGSGWLCVAEFVGTGNFRQHD